MKIITNVKQVEHLVLPTPVLSVLYHLLLEPFDGCIEVTDQFWSETSSQLLVVDECDTDRSMEDQSETVQHFLSHLQNTPEFVYLLKSGEQDYLFALSVLSDEGRGCYLLAPTESPTTLVKHLNQQAHPFGISTP